MTAHEDKQQNHAGLNLDQQIKFLKKIEFFENFDEHEIRQFLSVTKWLKVPSGKHIIKENTTERVFYILVRGKVSVIKTVDDGQRTVELTTLEAGACFGEMSLVMDVKRTAGVITKSESFLLMVEPGIINTSNVFLQLKFYKRFCEILVSRLIQANERMAGQEKPGDLDKLKEIKLPTQEDPGTTDKAKSPVPHQEDNEEKGSPQENPGQREETVMVLPSMPDKKDRIIKNKLQRLVSTIGDLPVNPIVAAQLRPLLSGECENTRLFADLVHLDPMISSKVLQVANSSFFRRSTPIATVPHAMITVGIKQIQEALAETVSQKSPTTFKGFSQLASSFWRHSATVARIAALLKDVIRLNISEDVYLAGLLHDIGILALDPIEPDFYPHLTDPDSEVTTALSDSESTYIGIDHGQAGCWFGEGIGIPETYLDVMRFHHCPEKARNNTLLTALVHLADLFATIHECGLGSQSLPPTAPLESYAWVVIQDHHRPFLEVNIADFVNTFNEELTNTWSSITNGLVF